MNDAAQLERRALAHTTGRSSRLAGISAIALACTLAAPVVAQDAPQVAQPIASPASGQAAGQVYTPEDFARYAPKTALDMISHVAFTKPALACCLGLQTGWRFLRRAGNARR